MLNDKIKIIHEDQDIVVIGKPSGVVTNRAGSVKDETIQDWFESNYLQDKSFPTDWQDQVPVDFSDEYGSPEEIFSQRLGMIHRLDKDTSGILIFAKHPGSLVNLLKQFKERQVQKEYLALVHGKFRVEEGLINLPLGRSRKDRKKFSVTIDGRPATTIYKSEQKYSGLNWDIFEKMVGESGRKITKSKFKKLYEAGFNLVRCFPKTGRTHQIRVHMAHEKHTLVGDKTYLGKKRAKVDPIWCGRHFLHAHSLKITHPRSSKEMRFEAKLNKDLQKVLELLVAE